MARPVPLAELDVGYLTVTNQRKPQVTLLCFFLMPSISLWTVRAAHSEEASASRPCGQKQKRYQFDVWQSPTTKPGTGSCARPGRGYGHGTPEKHVSEQSGTSRQAKHHPLQYAWPGLVHLTCTGTRGGLGFRVWGLRHGSWPQLGSRLMPGSGSWLCFPCTAGTRATSFVLIIPANLHLHRGQDKSQSRTSRT